MAEQNEVITKCSHILSNDSFSLGCEFCEVHRFSGQQMNIKYEDSISCGSDYDDIQAELVDDDTQDNKHFQQSPTMIKSEATSDCESILPQLHNITDFTDVIKNEPIDAVYYSSRHDNLLDEFYCIGQSDEYTPDWNHKLLSNIGIENKNIIEPTKHIKRKEPMGNRAKTKQKKVSSNNIEPNLITVPKAVVVRRDRRNRIRYRNHKCSFCSKMFVDKKNRSDHENTHTGNRPYQCEICSKTFAAYAALKRHTNLHTGDRSHQCSVCKQQFSQKTLLDIHTREQHLPDSDPRRYFPCKQCDAKLTTYGKMIHHKRKHRKILPVFVCDYCQKQFTSKPSLIAHITVHSIQMPYKCEFCFQTFPRRYEKTQHVVVCLNKSST